MYSTQNNLTNPTKVDLITLVREVESVENPTVVACTQRFYDLLKTRDPHTLYIITDTDQIKMYIGDCVVLKEAKVSSEYVIGFDKEHPEQYILYHTQYVKDHRYLQAICRYDDPKKAIEAMHIYSASGYHSAIHLKLYEMILQYIDRQIPLHQLLIGIFVVFNFKDNPMFNSLVTTINTYLCYESNLQQNPDLPINFKEELSRLKEVKICPLMREYNELYNIIFKYNFFKGEKYDMNQHDIIDLAEPIEEICNIFCTSMVKYDPI